MRVGVVSDTHNHLANVARIVEILNAAHVERVVHTGDITQAKTLHALAGLEAPLVGVYGNNDLERDSLESACSDRGFHFEDPPLELVWHERRILVAHDPLELVPGTLRGSDVLLHGHDHRHRSERLDGTLVFNPGECAGHLRGHNAVGILDLARLETGIVKF
jgi:putative phosphoesterase